MNCEDPCEQPKRGLQVEPRGAEGIRRVLEAAPGPYFRRGHSCTTAHPAHGFPQECVRRRAVLSVRANPVCPDEAAAERAVNEVWDSCFNDTRPFDEVMTAPACWSVAVSLTLH